MNRFLDRLGKKILIWDGATGTWLQNHGLKPGELPETWNVLHPDTIVQMHREYLQAGADIINTNTFGANSLKYQDAAAGPGNLVSVVRAALDCAEEARRLENRPDAAIALDLGPTGHMLAPLGDLAFEDAVNVYKEVIRAAKDRADLILIETMTDAYELKAAVLAAREAADLPVAATCAYGADEKLLTGLPPEGEASLLEGLGVSALGVNCSLGPKQMRGIVRRLLAVSSTPVIVAPNAGMPRVENGRTLYDVTPEEFAGEVRQIAEDGAAAVGGCCGTTPAYIRKLREAVAGMSPKPVAPKHRTVITSFGRAQTIGLNQAPVLIGERINPTGKKKLKEALAAEDYGYVLREGAKQEEAGAQVLDVNVGVPGIDEKKVLVGAVEKLQSVNPLPLQIDTSNYAAMEAAMRIYNGKPMINSANGREEICRKVFPLGAKYGAVIVCLLLDEHGIPETADGRIAVARKIIGIAAEYGLTVDDLVFDALALTVSSDSRSAAVTLETIRRLKSELHANTILGVSNISFGLPCRSALNATFFAMAMEEGLSTAIINPNSEPMMRAYDTWCALAGYDSQCLGYLRKYSEVEKKEKAEAAAVKKAREEAQSGRRAVEALQAIRQIAEGTPVTAAWSGAGSAAGAVFPAGASASAAPASASGQNRASGTGENTGAAGSGQSALSGNPAAGALTAAGQGVTPGTSAEAGRCGRNPVPGESKELISAIGKGLAEDAGKITASLLSSGVDALEIINLSLVPALNIAGDGFEKGKVYLPQLLMSADAAKAAFAEIRTRMGQSGKKQAVKGSIVLATVKGDIHDIGKNIVHVLLENYGYHVIDLGRDVEPEKIVEAARTSGAPLVGLSALMTTTVAAMEETIRLVHKELPGVKVIVGGAVLTEEYAEQIHADAYGKDAMATVRYAEKLFGKE